MKKAEVKKGLRVSLKIKWTLFISIVVFLMYLIFSIIVFQFVSESILRNEYDTVENAVTAVSSRFKNESDNLTKEKVNVILSNKKNNQSDTLIKQLHRSSLKINISNINNQSIFLTKDTSENSKKVNKLKISKIYKDGKVNKLVAHSPIKSKNNKVIGYIGVFSSMRTYHRTLDELLMNLFPTAIIALVISMIAGYFLVGLVLRRLKLINQTIDDVNESPNSNSRIPLQRQNDEITDVAERFNHMLDKLQSYTSQQKEFVQDVSHELRTPVAVVEGHLKLLNRWGKDDPEVLDESLKSSLQEIDRMKHLIQEMLDLTRIEQSKEQFKNEKTDIEPLFIQIYNDFRVLHPEFHINFDNDIRHGAKAKIYRNHLEQIIIILMDNAFKYSKDRQEINLAVSTNDNYLEFAVQDFGVGISLQNQDKIFNRFYRADKDRSRQSGGNGLGLAIAKQLVENYNGFMNVESIEGSGSVFRIEIPLVINNVQIKKTN